MNECVQCETPILGTGLEVTITIDESVSEAKAGQGAVEFCSPRCKRDWFDELIGLDGMLELSERGES